MFPFFVCGAVRIDDDDDDDDDDEDDDEWMNELSWVAWFQSNSGHFRRDDDDNDNDNDDDDDNNNDDDDDKWMSWAESHVFRAIQAISVTFALLNW